MAFRAPLKDLVEGTLGAVGAIFVDAEGETIESFTTGDPYILRLAGAHHGIVLTALSQAAGRVSSGDMLEEVLIRSDLFTYCLAPVEEGTFLVLVQDNRGLPSAGMRAVRETVPRIRELI